MKKVKGVHLLPYGKWFTLGGEQKPKRQSTAKRRRLSEQKKATARHRRFKYGK